MTHQTDERVDPLKALREELADLSASPEFAARVRQEIDADAGARGAGWLSGWRWLVPTAAAAAIVTAVFVMWRPTTEAPQQVVAQAPVETSNPLAAPQEAVAPSSSSAGVSRADSSKFEVRSSNSGRKVAEPEHLRTRGPENPSTSTSAKATVDKREPEVITNQPEILRALWARVGTNGTLVESTPTVLPDAVPEIIVKPIEVSPIVVKWLGDPQTAPATPTIRRVTADMAERSAK